jgi:hypothetical protein
MSFIHSRNSLLLLEQLWTRADVLHEEHGVNWLGCGNGLPEEGDGFARSVVSR